MPPLRTTLVWRAVIIVLVLIALYAVVLAVRGRAEGLSVSGTADQITDILWFSLLCGLAAYATLEIVKRLTRARGRYQLAAAESWFQARRAPQVDEPEPAAAPLDELLKLLGVGDEDQAQRLFSLPAEQVAAQIAGALETAAAAPNPPRLPWIDNFGQTKGEGEVDRLLLAQQIRLASDQLQIAMAEEWRRLVQASAVALAAIYAIPFTFAGGIDLVDQPRYIAMAGLVGGAAAWLIRDLTAIIEKARR